MIPPWIGVVGLGAAGQHVADRRRRVGVDVEVVGEVALRVEIDGEHAQPDPAEDVGQRADGGRLAGAALLGEDCDRLSHRAPIYGPAIRPGATPGRRECVGSGRPRW